MHSNGSVGQVSESPRNEEDKIGSRSKATDSQEQYNFEEAERLKALTENLNRRIKFMQMRERLKSEEISRARWRVLWTLVFSISSLTVATALVDPTLIVFLVSNKLLWVGLPVVVVSLFMVLMNFTGGQGRTFISIDEANSNSKRTVYVDADGTATTKGAVKEEEERDDSNSLSVDSPGATILTITPVDRFEAYLKEIVSALDNQIDLSERKASNLLDKGTTYIRSGIFFYVATICIWQIVPRSTEMSALTILGMVSCSLTFLVIEFLAAWFLRQYRSYVDSSTQLVRVKSVFNRYLLSYLGMKEFAGTDSASLTEMRAEILKVLSKDIKWPEVTPGKPGDFNHMIEMFDSLSTFVDKAKGIVKSDKPAKVEE